MRQHSRIQLLRQAVKDHRELLRGLLPGHRLQERHDVLEGGAEVDQLDARGVHVAQHLENPGGHLRPIGLG
ncbi:MAG: hypothetical protein HY595_04230 [Candidatus Omnitrophica bacterium]|nr:hypothetical protein [Candidatus Omnitrophota bacterium]